MAEKKPITFVYEGDLTVRAQSKEQSADLTIKDYVNGPPIDVEYLQSVELLGAVIPMCMVCVILNAAKKKNIDLKELTVDMAMTLDDRSYVKTIDLKLCSPFTAEKKVLEDLEAAWERCPVRNSLHPDIKLAFSFEWGKQCD